jgi:hypothetical protein
MSEAATKASVPAVSEEELAKSINEKIYSMLNSFRSSITHAMDVGDLLIQAKKRVGHGNFEVWVATHCQLSPRTARRYINLANDRPKIVAQLAAKSATLTDLNAQGLLTDQSGGGGDGNGTSRTASDKYDLAQTNLIKKLKDLDVETADASAADTVKKLKDAVAVMRANTA